jgi:GNAT superfamily N-acetyltransferase
MARFAEVIALTPAEIRDNDVWVVERAGQVIGFYGLVHHGEVAELDHLWLRPEEIGHGLGRLTFEDAMRRAREMDAHRLEWEAEPNAVGFYRRMGGIPIREVTSELGRRLEVFALDLAGPA